MGKIDLSPAIIVLEKELMKMNDAVGMVNVYGLTPTELNIQNEKLNSILAPYREAIRILKIKNHVWTELDIRKQGIGIPIEQIITSLKI